MFRPVAILCFAWYFSPQAAANEQKLMSGVLGQIQGDLAAAPDWLCLALGGLLAILDRRYRRPGVSVVPGLFAGGLGNQPNEHS